MKYLLSIIGVMTLLPSVPAVAADCSSYGVTVGATCNGNDSVVVISNCTVDASYCTYKECDGRCVCATNGVCPTTSGDSGCGSVSCESVPTWSSPKFTGVQSGTISLLNKTSCKCENVIVQRCAEGYYVNSVTNLSGYYYPYTNLGAFAKSVTCTVCPSAEGDSSLNAGAPSYVTSTPSAMKDFRGAGGCKIKANTDIPDSTGKYQYASPCSYTTDSGMITL